MDTKPFTCLFGGEAGYGVMSAGSLVAKSAMRSGLSAVVVNEYPSLIKGGLNTCLVRIAEQTLLAYEEEVDFLGALSQPAFELNIGRVKKGGSVLYDTKAVRTDSIKTPEGVRLIGVDLSGALPEKGAKIMLNSVLLGGFCALSGFPAASLQATLEAEFSKAEVREKNRQAFENGRALVASVMTQTPSLSLRFSAAKGETMLINGNEAIAMAAIKGGCKFAAGYPMTPGSSVLSYLAEYGAPYGVVFKQAEDEIAAMNMLIGASFAGARCIGSTSGGGFALMTEALGFAAQAEIPLVMVNAQRGGPSTGQPTRTAQADLNFVLHASQGEFPRIIVAPGDVEECFYETFRLLNLVEKYQVQGIILTDKYLADSSFVQPFFKQEGLVIERGKRISEEELEQQERYLRYQLTEDGVSPRALPGQRGGRHIATSYSHGEDGFYSSGNHEYAGDEPQNTVAMLDKWYRKIPVMLRDIPGATLYGPQEADLTLIAWGSTKGAILEALAQEETGPYRVNFLQLRYIEPFPTEIVAAVLSKAKKTLLIEGNKTAQLGGVIRRHTGLAVDHLYLKYDSRPFVPTGIREKIREVMG
ncbi:2-oxoacid:acceptor oxidoreductase subunit alpha [Azotosporobacter soli]|uniref:2-oxoacid:acceptor oxidoreductase subunit alpha n=1 Tax=Azotosporobacter soli TaxID=3055040 RepID=UPI0031FE9B94